MPDFNSRRLIRPTGYTFSLAKRRAWYADDTPASDATTPETTPASDTPAKVEKTFDEAYVKELRKEAEKYRIALREKEKAEEARAAKEKDEETKKLAANSEFEKLAQQRAAELDKLKNELADERINNLRIRVGVEFKLPSKLIERLQGTTEDELKADAQALVEELGLNKQPEAPATPPNAQTPPQARRQTTAVAPTGQPATETDEQTRARMYKRGAVNSPLFRPTDK